VQVETKEALARLEAIAAVDGVDGVFLGPSDLSASLGHLGEPGHPEVKAAVLDGIRRMTAVRKPAGLITADAAFAEECLAAGALFVAVGIDAAVLARGADELAARFCHRVEGAAGEVGGPVRSTAPRQAVRPGPGGTHQARHRGRND
jgi:4-hydroxy-2-oxoheptanedioate aldolase